jgi:hypothetical protein
MPLPTTQQTDAKTPTRRQTFGRTALQHGGAHIFFAVSGKKIRINSQ